MAGFTVYEYLQYIMKCRVVPCFSDRPERDYTNKNWNHVPFPTSTPMLSSQPPVFSSQQDGVLSVRTSQENPLINSQEISTRNSYDAQLRSSQDLPLRNFQDMPLRSSQEMLLRSSQEVPLRSSQEVPLRRSQDLTLRGSQDMPLRCSQEMPLRNIQDIPVRNSQELHRPVHDYNQGAGVNDGFQSDGYHSNSEQGSMTPTYAQNINPQAFDWISRTGNPQQEVMSHVQQEVMPQGQQEVMPQGQHDMHNLYRGYQAQNEPDSIPSHYPPLPLRQETEGGNIQHNLLSHFQHLPHPGFYKSEDQPRSGNFEAYSNVPHPEGYLGTQQNYYVPSSLAESQQTSYDHTQTNVPRLQLSPRKEEEYKVHYRGQGEITQSDEEETYSARKERRKLMEEKGK